MTKNSSLVVLAAVLVCGSAAWAKAPLRHRQAPRAYARTGPQPVRRPAGACSGHGASKTGIPRPRPLPLPLPLPHATKAAASTAATAPVVGAAEPAGRHCDQCGIQSGACSGHGGIKDWYSATPAAPAPAATAAHTTKAGHRPLRPQLSLALREPVRTALRPARHPRAVPVAATGVSRNGMRPAAP
jgi:hypothetical protein